MLSSRGGWRWALPVLTLPLYWPCRCPPRARRCWPRLQAASCCWTSRSCKGQYSLSTLPQPARVAEFISTAYGSRLGWALRFAPLAAGEPDSLLLAAPMLALNTSSREVGALFVFRGGDTFPSGGRSLDAVQLADYVVTGSQRNERLGSAVEVADLDGDRCSELYLGAPHASPAQSEMAGLCRVYSQGASCQSGHVPQ